MDTKWIVVGVLIAGTAGCAYNIKGTSDYDTRVNFSNYSTFFVLPGNSSGDSVMDERLASDVKNTLMSKGWIEVPEGDGQTAVVVHTATSTAHTYESFYNGWGGWHWRTDGFNGPAGVVEDYKSGTAVVTVFDADTKQAIWRGYAPGAISANSKHATKMREDAVARLFAKFPPAQ